MFIKNRSQLISKDLKKTQKFLRNFALNCLERALNAVKPRNLMESSIKIRDNKFFIKNDIFDLRDFNNIYIIGGGKATAEMAITLEKMLTKFTTNIEGIVNIPQGLKFEKKFKTKNIKLNYATHPIPNENGLFGTKKMLELVKKSSENDLIFCLISGGGSALLPLPKDGITLEDIKEINSLLLHSGASIHEINTIRKHISKIKGGNLAKIIFNTSRATLISLIISDVVGNNLDSIASGPSIPDLTTFKNVKDILTKYNLYYKIPDSIKNEIKKGLNGQELENPKPNHPCFKNVYNYLIGSVNSAVQEIITYIEPNFTTNYFSNTITGEAKEFGKELLSIISHYIKKSKNQKQMIKLALIGSGELTVTIKGKGIGGRNQEMLLSFLYDIKDKIINYNFLIVAVNLDGIEGNSKAMGALIDNYTLTQIKKMGLNIKYYLNNNDSNSFFRIIGSEIITGPTGCNVNDLILILILNNLDL